MHSGTPKSRRSVCRCGVGRGESFPDGAGVERETGESVLSLKKAKREAAAQRRPAKTTQKTAFFFVKRRVVWCATRNA